MDQRVEEPRAPRQAPTPQEAQESRPTAANWLRHKLKPHGRTNRNLALTVCIIVGAIVFLWAWYAQPQSATGKRKDVAQATPTPRRSSIGIGSDRTGPPEVAPGNVPPLGGAYPQASPQGTPFGPSTAPPTYSAPPLRPYVPSETAAPHAPVAERAIKEEDASPFAYQADSKFGAQLHEGNPGAPVGAKPSGLSQGVAGDPLPMTGKTEEPEGDQDSTSNSPLPVGTEIAMRLLRPAASGLASFVKVVVTTPVRDAAGKIVIPAGTQGRLPFAADEFHGRLTLNTSRSGVLVVGSRAIEVQGSVLGADGRPGIRGEIKGQRGGPNLVARGLRGAARMASGSMGALGGRVAIEAEQAMAERGGALNSYSREVVAKEGTVFTFVVGM